MMVIFKQFSAHAALLLENASRTTYMYILHTQFIRVHYTTKYNSSMPTGTRLPYHLLPVCWSEQACKHNF